MASREHTLAWLDEYERAWRAVGTDALQRLFTANASYQQSPYDDPLIGLDAISDMWEREREGPDEQFTMDREIVAVDGAAAVVRVAVYYAGPPPREYRDLWVIRFDEAGRCEAFEEWPFWPGQPHSAPRKA